MSGTHDEWLLMKLCMYVGYHDANKVSHFGSGAVTQLNLKKSFILLLAGLPGFARDHCSIIISISAFYF